MLVALLFLMSWLLLLFCSLVSVQPLPLSQLLLLV